MLHVIRFKDNTTLSELVENGNSNKKYSGRNKVISNDNTLFNKEYSKY